MAKPLMIDLFCGLGGGTEGAMLEGFDCVGFDVERHRYQVTESHFGGLPKIRMAQYPAQLVLQDVLTIHGSQFRNAAYIWASPPCQTYSWMAMPFSRGKREAAWQRWERDSPFGDFHLNDLFDACFRIQREACEAAGRYIPMVVENVKGAQPWVGRAKANYGSFYLWGDVEMVGNRVVAGLRFGDGLANGKRTKTVGHVNMRDGHEHSFQSAAVQKQPVWFNDDKRKCGGDWFSAGENCSLMRSMSSKSSARKAASAQIAKIPLPLSRYIARSFKPPSGQHQAAPRRVAAVSGARGTTCSDTRQCTGDIFGGDVPSPDCRTAGENFQPAK